MEAAELGLFMVSAGLFATFLESPGSPIREAVTDSLLRRTLMGAAMGITVMGVIDSPWGRQPGGPMNPALTFASALPSGIWTAGWIYVTAPVLGMLLAAESFRRSRSGEARCAKLHHHTARRCIFRCGYRNGRRAREART